MKKKMKQKEKSLLKSQNFKYLKIAQVMCLVFVVLFMMLIGVLMYQNSLSYQALIMQRPALTIGFFACSLNLFIAYKLNKVLHEIGDTKHTELARIQIAIYAFSEFLLFNYPAAILMAFLLYKNFEWPKGVLSDSFVSIKKHQQRKILVFDIAILAFLILMSLWFVVAFSRL